MTARVRFAAVLLAVASLVGCASTVDVAGSVEVSDNCHGSIYGDVHSGTEVTIYNGPGEIVATTSLDPGKTLNGRSCLYPFKVTGVSDSDFYQVEVSHRGKVTFTREQFEGDDVALTLGPA